MAIEWKDVGEDGQPEREGQYIVYCYNYQISSDLIDLARWENGHWCLFRSCLNQGMLVYRWAYVNWPKDRIYLKEMGQ